MDILATIPHRPPFLFLDEIVECAETRLVAKRTIRGDEPHFAGHYPGNPIMPGVLLCEATFQAGAVLLVSRMQATGGSAEGLTPILSRIGEAKFKSIVRPGDSIQIEVEHKETMGQFHFLRAKITNNGKLALTIEFALALIKEQK
ncbi:MAG: 3-hydroxyacyl-ACP dehydratase FabZ family protein [Verrucomicrobiota bacterium]|nr:3-hydroxyacyl-ACP dehydratase FabZ family protein [Verrucomicrobiota bacterium]